MEVSSLLMRPGFKKAFLEELVHKMATGQITLRMLDLRGLETNLVGLNGSDTVREKLTRTGAEIICDEQNLLQEKYRYRQ